MKKIAYLINVMLVLLLFTDIAVAKNKTDKLTGIYSDMHYITEADDIIGMEVIIGFASKGPKSEYYAIVQESDGWPSLPEVVKIIINGNLIEFVLHKGTKDEATFKGKITSSAIIGRFGNGDIITLKKGNSFWQNKQ